MTRPALLLASLGLIAFSQAPEVRLAAPTGVIDEPFSDIYGLAEFDDGRLVVADRIERAFYLTDFGTQERRSIGRTGPGPNEFLSAFGVIRWRGDTLLGYDASGRKLVKFTVDGAIAGSFSMALPGKLGGTSPPRALDSQWRLYWDTPVILPETKKRDLRANILRWAPGDAQPEVAATYTDHAEFEHRFSYRPWPSMDAWTATPDGRVAVLSASEYRLRWLENGRVVDSGPPIAYERLPVRAAERDAFRAMKATEPMSGASTSGKAASTGSVQAARAKAAWPDSLFPSHLPPFEERGMLLAPGGELWVKRLGRGDDVARRVDVLSARGQRRATIRLPDHTRLVALGTRGVYLIKVDEDGLQTLQRYAYPPVR